MWRAWMTSNSDHTLREMQQVNMLLKKIITKIESPSISFGQKMQDIEQVSIAANNVLKKLPDNNQISTELLDKINNDLKNPLTPVNAYVQLFLSGYLGELTDAQKQKLQIISDNLKELESAIRKLF